jgi:O-antigen/teichoic acid export membrane protein
MAGQVVQVVIAFAANIVLVRYIAPEGFGRFAITLATASLIVSLLSIRVNTLIIRVPDGELTPALEERYFSYLTIETLFALVVGLVWVSLSGNAGKYEFALVVLVCIQHWVNQNKSFFERGIPYVRLGLIVSFPPKTGPLFLETEGGCDGSETSFRRGRTESPARD